MNIKEIIEVLNEAKINSDDGDVLKYIKKHYPQLYEICKIIFNKNEDLVSTSLKFLDAYDSIEFESSIKYVDPKEFLDTRKNPYLNKDNI